MSVKDQLQDWLSEGEMERLSDALKGIARKYGDKYFQKDVTHQVGRYNGLIRDKNNGLINDQFFSIQLNNIRVGFQSLIDKLPPRASLPDDNTTTENVPPTPDPPKEETEVKPEDTSPPTKPPVDTKNQSGFSPKHIPWIVGLLLLLGSAVTILGFIPCPTPSQEVILRLLMSLGAGGLAVLLPGMFQIEIMSVKAASAIGFAVLVYLVNPASVLADDSRCQVSSFEFTINVQPDGKISPRYPKLDDEILQLWVANKWEKTAIDADGLADYKSLPGEIKDKKVRLHLQSSFWTLKKDSITLTGKSRVAAVIPSGILSKVSGQVLDSSGANALEGVAMSIFSRKDTTDTNGYFSIEIPPQQQQREYTVIGIKAGYRTFTERITYDGESIAFRMEKLE
jgi:hypothetical protein